MRPARNSRVIATRPTSDNPRTWARASGRFVKNHDAKLRIEQADSGHWSVVATPISTSDDQALIFLNVEMAMKQPHRSWHRLLASEHSVFDARQTVLRSSARDLATCRLFRPAGRLPNFTRLARACGCAQQCVAVPARPYSDLPVDYGTNATRARMRACARM
jgi:hypothetical protein